MDLRPSHALSSLAFALMCAAAHAQTKYRLADLGPFATGVYYTAARVNASGVVGSMVFPGATNEHAFVSLGGGARQDLGTLGGPYSIGYALSDSGQYVGGASRTSDNTTRAFLYSNGVMQNVGSLGGQTSVIKGVNDSGEAVGWSDRPNGGGSHAILYSNGVVQDLGTLGGFVSEAVAISSNGVIAGSSENAAHNANHAFVRMNGQMQDLGTLYGGNSWALGVNNLGDVVGYSVTLAGDAHAFLYSNGVMKDLGGGDGAAYGTNDLGQVVGILFSSTNTPFLYANGVRTNLQTLLDPSVAGWTLTGASSIDNQGRIGGAATFSDGKTHAVLLTPVPEPASFVALGLGALAVARRRKRA